MEAITEQENDMAAGIAIGCAAQMMEGGADVTDDPAVRAMWPEGLSADALGFGAQIALAIAIAFDLDGAKLGAVAAALIPAGE